MNQHRESDCSVAVAALVTALEQGEAIDHKQRLHLIACPHCSRIVRDARLLQRDLESAGPDDIGGNLDVPAVGQEVASQSRTRDGRRLFAALAIGAVFVLVILAFIGAGASLAPIEVALASTIVTLVIVLPVVLIVVIRRSLRSGAGRPLYRRLRSGRQLSGVCLGISEHMGFQVSVVRLVFVVLALFDGVGLWLYVILGLVLPVHPDDREHLLRFRLARFFRSSSAARES